MRFDILDKHTSLKHIITEKNLDAGYSFSMALHTGEDRDSIISNRRGLGDVFGYDAHYMVATQTHSDIVAVVDRHDESWMGRATPREADALITNLPNIVLNILTADCVPILLYDPSVGAIGAVHAGWRGTQQGILSATIAQMREEYGCNPSDILAGIGPAIGGCCYEVDIGVAGHFMEYGDSVSDRGNQKYHLDLKSINHAQLIEAGVLESHIETSLICTACQNDRFFSYRQECGCSGRFVSAIMIDGS